MWRATVGFFDKGGRYSELALAQKVHGDRSIDERWMR
jgi:hypothetical protein